MKLLKVLVAALLLAAMVTPAIAEDRLSLSGEMRVRGYWYDTDYSDIDGLDDKGAWNDQRLRMLGKIAVAEGVSVVFRFDATESDENSSDAVSWGGSSSKVTGGSAYQYSQRRGDIQFDMAYLQVELNGFTLKAGQQYFGFFGNSGKMMDVIGAGFIGSYKGFTLAHIKRMDENQGKNTFTGNYEGDASLTSVKYDFKGDGFSVTPIVSYNRDKHTTNYDLLGFGLSGSFDAGPVKIKGEFNYFDGETDAYTFYTKVGSISISDVDPSASDVDMEGLQFYLDASMAATDTVTLGLQGFYAKGQDDAIQATNMNRDANVLWTFADWHPESYGYQSTEFVDEFYDIYDPAGMNQGVMAIQLYADVKATDDLSLKFAAMYFEPEDDFIVDYDGYTLNAGFAYNLAKNTVFNTAINYISWSFDNPLGGSSADLDTLQAISQLSVKF